MATPFVEGRLRSELLSVEIATGCAHCGKRLHLEVDQDLRCTVLDAGAHPRMFVPRIDWKHFHAKNIVADY